LLVSPGHSVCWNLCQLSPGDEVLSALARILGSRGAHVNFFTALIQEDLNSGGKKKKKKKKK
jgi:hypothetical protein